MASLIDIGQLTWRYPNAENALFNDLSLQIKPGEFVAIVGGSGVGKSTLLRLVNGLIEAESGTVALNTRNENDRRGHAMVFQDSRLLPWKTVAGNLEFALKALKLSKAERAKRINESLALTGLSDFADRYPHQLSGGQAQRVGIARALSVKPSVLLMDEPFSAIDAITRKNLQLELLRVWEQTEAAVLFVTHDIDEAVTLADRIIVLGGAPARIVSDESVNLPRPRLRSEAAFHVEVERWSGRLSWQ